MDTSRVLNLQGTLIPHLHFFQEIKEGSHVPKGKHCYAQSPAPSASQVGLLASCPLGDKGEGGGTEHSRAVHKAPGNKGTAALRAVMSRVRRLWLLPLLFWVTLSKFNLSMKKKIGGRWASCRPTKARVKGGQKPGIWMQHLSSKDLIF